MIAQLLTIALWTTGMALVVLYVSFIVPLTHAANVSAYGEKKGNEEYQSWRNGAFGTALERSTQVSFFVFIVGLVAVIALSIVQAVS